MRSDKPKRQLSRKKGAKAQRRCRGRAAERASISQDEEAPRFKELEVKLERLRARLGRAVRYLKHFDTSMGGDHSPKLIHSELKALGKQCKAHPWWGRPMQACMRRLLHQIHLSKNKIGYYIR